MTAIDVTYNKNLTF